MQQYTTEVQPIVVVASELSETQNITFIENIIKKTMIA